MDIPAQFTSLAIIEILILELIWCSFSRMNINIFLMQFLIKYSITMITPQRSK